MHSVACARQLPERSLGLHHLCNSLTVFFIYSDDEYLRKNAEQKRYERPLTLRPRKGTDTKVHQ